MNSRKTGFRILKIVAISLAVIIIAAVLIAITLLGFIESGKSKLFSNDLKPSLPSSDSGSDDDTGAAESHSKAYYSADVLYNGKAYNYRSDLINLLFIGVDKKSDIEERNQADALYLIVFDKETKAADVIAISRATYAPVKLYDSKSGIFTEDNLQVCLAYGYGTDDRSGSELTVDSVSKLFYGLPINGYFTFFINEVPKLVEAVDGVQVTLQTDMSELSPAMTAGATVILNSENVIRYLTWRNDSNAVRVKNHLAFIHSLADKVKSKLASNPAFLFTLYDSLKKVSVTDITADSATYLLSLASNVSINEFINLEGTSGLLNGTEVVYLDDTALYQQIIDKFYEEVK